MARRSNPWAGPGISAGQKEKRPPSEKSLKEDDKQRATDFTGLKPASFWK